MFAPANPMNPPSRTIGNPSERTGNPVSGLIDSSVTASDPRRLRGLVVRQGPDVHRCLDVVLADHVRPRVEEDAVATTVLAGGQVVDVARVPVCGPRDLRVGASATLVDPGDDAMIAVLEAHVDGVDLLGGGERSIQQLPALLRSEDG